eukprot:gene30028-39218_t
MYHLLLLQLLLFVGIKSEGLDRNKQVSSRHHEIVSKYSNLVMARDAQKWATEIFDQDGTFQTSGKTFTGHEEMIAAAVHLFNLCTALKYDVHKIYSVSEDQILTEGTITYTVTGSLGETQELEPIPIWAEFDLVPNSMLILHYRSHINKSTLFAAGGELAEQTWIDLKTVESES